MNISGEIDLRLEFSDGSHFIDVGMVNNYKLHSFELTLIDSFCSWLIYKNEHGYIKIAVFPTKEWRDEWWEALKIKPKILLEG